MGKTATVDRLVSQDERNDGVSSAFWRGEAVLVSLSEPCEGASRLWVSESNCPFGGWETFAFEADAAGSVWEWNPLEISQTGVASWRTVLEDAGYEVVER